MGNKLMQQCTTDDSKIQGFNGDMSAVIANHPHSTIQMEAPVSMPVRNAKVEHIYQQLLKQKTIEYTLEPQKSTFKPVRLHIFEQSGIFIGWIKNGKPHGPGQIYFDSQKYLQAIFKEGQVYCEEGLYIEPTGNYYRGGFKKSKQNGVGILRKGEDSLVGTFEKGMASGKGIKHYADGRIFKGIFNNGMMEGKGTLSFPNGNQYSGYFREDQCEGVGHFKTQKYAYFGPYKRNKKEGKGTVLFSDGSKFQGWFENDKIQGYGEWHRPNGTIQKGKYSLSLPS